MLAHFLALSDFVGVLLIRQVSHTELARRGVFNVPHIIRYHHFHNCVQLTSHQRHAWGDRVLNFWRIRGVRWRFFIFCAQNFISKLRYLWRAAVIKKGNCSKWHCIDVYVLIYYWDLIKIWSENILVWGFLYFFVTVQQILRPSLPLLLLFLLFSRQIEVG